eukprot:scaffold14574_cov120-Isochrysis_galbana.AAC.4
MHLLASGPLPSSASRQPLAGGLLPGSASAQRLRASIAKSLEEALSSISAVGSPSHPPLRTTPCCHIRLATVACGGEGELKKL